MSSEGHPVRDPRNPVAGRISCPGRLVGDAAVIREWVETRQLNSGVGDQAKAKILVWPAKERDSLTIGEGTLLYPEIDTHHAVINRIKEKLVS